MNDYCYKTLLIPFIPHNERAVLQLHDWWLLPIKRIHKSELFCSLLVDVLLHCGTPCKRRYCICMYFSHTDKARFFKERFDF